MGVDTTRLAELLRTRGHATAEQIAAASLEAALPSTAFTRAGVLPQHVMLALVELTGLAAAPPHALWRTEVRRTMAVSDDVWIQARAVPIGKDKGTLIIAFADLASVSGAAESLGPHIAVLAFEDDVMAALAPAVDDIAGHIVAGGVVDAAAPPTNEFVPRTSAPPPKLSEVHEGIGSQLGAALTTNKGLLIGALVAAALVVVGVKGTGAFIALAAKDPRAEKLERRGERSDADIAALMAKATAALDAGDANGAEAASSELLEKHSYSAAQAVRAYLVRARARLANRNPLAAIGDLSRVIEGSDEREVVAEALGLRGRAYADTGDLDNALADLDRCLGATPNQAVRARASLDRGLVKRRKGDTEGARTDLKWAADYTRIHTAVHDEAVAALEAL